MARCVVRPALPADVDRLQAIEDAADALFVDLAGSDAWPPAAPGAERATAAGFLLVAAPADDRGTDDPGGHAVGFVHVLEVDGEAHLEQLSVLPSHGRSGHGRALVEAAKGEARARGFARLTLRTFADVAWNAPFYATCGFVETVPTTPFQHRLVEVENRLGLERHGRRILMEARLVPPRRS